ncbi:hypothetical protein [Tatumella sp. OPLPL6]|uniref:hypothetical protein n=1 Tax=Tatumella sp. OPLPL6 TaxID=1928657 RepID=UPI000C1A0DBE|nr:hypothetical protein [Tatumella sp. OPLPL6]PIJ42124.1 hypothetical protein BOM24_13145 [Tatumella sp. OPLPL6]
MSKETGGPAFPVSDLDHQVFKPKSFDEAKRLLSGMDLRDYFAAKAMQGLIPIYWDSVDEYSDASELVKCLSTAAYEHADEMLKARVQ